MFFVLSSSFNLLKETLVSPRIIAAIMPSSVFIIRVGAASDNEIPYSATPDLAVFNGILSSNNL